ncbi:sialidase family protein [Thiorhodococcus minor]|uniref:Exo-alpha-sialidase n=1 Tax=Thiorhodococcus minor TaxID=57489 RepID=A0A6M0K0D2_9GAMM|nr:sialidase family protein [Thiorhodococcus minor]NEV62819.1 exo-alpha-sialidase [Thiorhodococcus minor]
MWRDKHPRKGLYFLTSASEDAKPAEVGDDTEPLARFVARSDSTGDVHLLWYGEKLGEPTGSEHNLYYGRWREADPAATAPELVMPGIYPVMTVKPSGDVMAFSWQPSEDGGRVYSRFRPAKGGEASGENRFQDAVVIAAVPQVTPIVRAFTSGERWLFVWLGQYGADRRDFRLEGAYSDDNGTSWTRFALDDLRGFDVASLQVAADAKQHIVLVVTARDRSANDDSKQNVFALHSADAGTTWSSAVALRRPTPVEQEGGTEDQDPLALFSARNPSVAFGATPGEVLAVWEDWRGIRAGIYAAVSRDYGKTWSTSVSPLMALAGANLGLRYEPNAIFPSDAGYSVVAERYSDDTLEKKRLVRLDIPSSRVVAIAEGAGASPWPGDTEVVKQALRERATAYWNAIKEGEFSDTYEYLDPFFRARFPLDRYLATMGRIKYSQADVEGVRIAGSIAEVSTRIRASIPEFRMPTTGELVSRPEREVTVKNRWLWIDGRWLKEFRVESQDVVFTRY